MTKQIDQALDARIQKAARWLCRTCPQLADDAAQQMWLEILQRAETDPTFLDQAPAYIVTYGSWRAARWLEKFGYRGNEDASPDDEIGEDVTLGDVMAGREMTVERYVISRVTLEAALAVLDETARALAVGLLMGYGKQQMARKLGRSPAWATGAGRRIAAAVTG
jgi:hypothetical protein